MVEISESYRGSGHYKWMRPTVDRLLQSLPPELLTGLGTIVLTDAHSIGPGKTQRVRGRKHHRNKCLGFYHHRTQSEVAFIELVADNIAPSVPRLLLHLQFFRDMFVSQTLFHEIGHHLTPRRARQLGMAKSPQRIGVAASAGCFFEAVLVSQTPR